MKTSRRSGAVLCLALLLGPVLVRAAAGEAAAPPQTHVLFMGANLAVQQDGKLCRVEDISGSNLVIRVGKELVTVPTRTGALGLQVSPKLKLTDSSVKLDGLKSGPAYTPGNDPARKLRQAANNSVDVALLGDMNEANLMRSVNYQSVAQHSVDSNGYEMDKRLAELADAKTTVAQSEAQLDKVAETARGDYGNVGAGAERMQAAEGDYDAMEVTFKVSSPVELESPYMMVLFHFHDPAAKPGVDGMVIHLQALEPIGARPRYVRVLKGGLPIGFKFVDCAIHVYNRGREVATNLSTDRVEMNRGETQQYILMEYVGTHKGADASASGVPGSLPLEQRRQLASDQLSRPLYVKVREDGTPLAVFADESCNLLLQDPATTDALTHAFFLPALQQGKPVEGVARVRLDKL